MKPDWTKPRMRLSLPAYCNDSLAFLLFLRLTVVAFLCFPCTLVLSKIYGTGIGLIACLLAYPLWWYHFGLPRFKEQRSGFFSARFCLMGYVAMTAALLIVTLEFFDVIQEGKPVHLPALLPKSNVLRFLIIFSALWGCDFAKRKFSKKDR